MHPNTHLFGNLRQSVDLPLRAADWKISLGSELTSRVGTNICPLDDLTAFGSPLF
ncbi:hypothetical protein RGR602_PB00046 (plasmid) [Rhizobium gallicum bv. gallicum R602sp]|uniref:Uncharacterized protein n=1 Tax=Rhizobium gallicum bv. gallicum R602sp TaxID=1041138 RepID=A0A0B4XAN3_9HYPH|nr:hypothetical protein RGR602_PB00046 [Rhizobium gallicum bv. gallicum R602sp]